MTLSIATKHTSRVCRYCKTPIYIGCAYYELGHGKIKCDTCERMAILIIAWLLIKLNK